MEGIFSAVPKPWYNGYTGFFFFKSAADIDMVKQQLGRDAASFATKMVDIPTSSWFGSSQQWPEHGGWLRSCHQHILLITGLLGIAHAPASSLCTVNMCGLVFLIHISNMH